MEAFFDKIRNVQDQKLDCDPELDNKNLLLVMWNKQINISNLHPKIVFLCQKNVNGTLLITSSAFKNGFLFLKES